MMKSKAMAMLTPKVKVFFSAKSRLPLPQEIVDLAKWAGQEKIIGREDPQEWGFRNLDELWSGLPEPRA